jgi:hypothetical protein
VVVWVRGTSSSIQCFPMHNCQYLFTIIFIMCSRVKPSWVRVDLCSDLRDFATRLGLTHPDPALSVGGLGLRSLAQWLCGHAPIKDAAICQSDWSADPLSPTQLAYAAADAFYSRAIVLSLFNVAHARSTHRKLASSSASATALPLSAPHSDEMGSYVHGIVDLRHKNVCSNSPGPAAAPHAPAATAIADAKAEAEARMAAKAQRALQFYEKAALKKAVYDNCRILSPAGELMCNCSAKKIQWYLERQLATPIDDRTIQLLFAPKGPGNRGDEFYLAAKENMCVVCGNGAQFVRHSIVPHAFRSLFPEKHKSHSSHDIVLLCPACHQRTQPLMASLRKQIFRELNIVPPVVRPPPDRLAMQRAVGLARSLLKNGDRMPTDRRTELQDELCDILQRPAPMSLVEMRTFVQHPPDSLPAPPSEPSDPQVAAVAGVAALNSNSSIELELSAEQQVMATLDSDDRILAFVRRWRALFLDSMAPRFLSPHWRVDHEDPM